MKTEKLKRRIAYCGLLLILSINSIFARDITVDTSWLLKNINNKELIIIDTRSLEDFKAAHIKGAINLPTNDTFRDDNPKYLIKKSMQLEEMLQGVGVSNSLEVILYDNGDLLNSSRLFWILEFLGHEKVGIYVDGLKSWREKKHPIESGYGTNRIGDFKISINSNKIATLKMVKLAIKNEEIAILDGRDVSHYDGSKSITALKGHIPTALSFPAKSYFKNNELISNDKIEKKFKSVVTKKQIITYCNKGKQSSLLYFLLRKLGYSKVRHYDGSWPEWSTLEVGLVEL
ncbi:MAG: sulfurtransferase [Bacteriovoracaceae bacterium]|jgi:3-mercaptopyruvate sulfurtransferase SseA|nr:sulfurtransferase [Bacteriovoracaceae bacterium]